MRRCQDDLGLRDDLAHDAALPPLELLAQVAHLAPHLLALAAPDAVLAAPTAQLALERRQVALDVVEELARVALRALRVERVSREARKDARRVPDSRERDRLVEVGVRDREAGEDVVDCEVARAADEDALARLDELADDLDERVRLAGTRRTPQERDLVARERKLDGLALRLVEVVVDERERRVARRTLRDRGLLLPE